MPLIWAQVVDMTNKIHDDPFRHSGNIKPITSTIFEAAVIVLLMGWIHEVCC
jgi:hypothetical protein